MAARRNIVDRRTIPFDFAELERLRTQSAAAHRPAPRAATVSDPMTMSVLAEIERLDHEAEPEPPRRDSNRHLKPRGGS
jgi:hypothetical protein